jgi:hypothetical protein
MFDAKGVGNITPTTERPDDKYLGNISPTTEISDAKYVVRSKSSRNLNFAREC